ncbi:MAG TPA: hypothetical protein VLE95_08980 [Chlamydiales bacterium]|nr:hypothetical protein [Chlamydiales bacterium]
MKPRSIPGRAGTAGRATRSVIAKAKMLSVNQVQHLQQKKAVDLTAAKAGRKGPRARWNIDYEEGNKCDAQAMPCREPETFTIKGTRRWPKRNPH